MSPDPDADSEKIIHLADGTMRFGATRYEPWPSLRQSPPGDSDYVAEILGAQPGSRFWPYASTIPEAVRRQVRAFPHNQLGLLEFCAANPERGFELVVENPALAVLVVRFCRRASYERRRENLERAAAKSWRGLLSDLDLPVRPRTIRILKKLPVAPLALPTILKLRKVLRAGGHPWVHVLPHLPKISRDTVGLLSMDPALVTPVLLRASAESQPDEETVTWLLGSIRGLLTELGREGRGPTADSIWHS